MPAKTKQALSKASGRSVLVRIQTAGKGFPTEFPLDAVGGIVYLGLIATALCLFMQSYGLKYAEPAIGGMLISLESVFGVLFSILLYHERITARMLLGFAVIFCAILLSQWDGDLSRTGKSGH